jgi:hypothetical protein
MYNVCITTCMSAEPLFDSSPAAPDTTQAKGTYEHALYALHHDAGVAENLFARLAKTDFASLLTNVECERADEGAELYPLRVVQQTLAFEVKDLPTNPKDEGLVAPANMLRGIVARAADSVLEHYDKRPILLIGSLHVRVQNLGGGKVSFSLKQKWGSLDG